MNKQIPIQITGIILLVFLISCKTTQTGMIVGDNYDENRNQTTLTLLPHGNIVLPDKWTKSSYNPISKQHYFRNNDSSIVAIAKNQKQDYPFCRAEQTDKDFLNEFTKWESDYFKTLGATVTILEDQSPHGYMLWQTAIDKENIYTIYLFGLKGSHAYNFSCNSRIWSHKEIQSFLIQLFNDN